MTDRELRELCREIARVALEWCFGNTDELVIESDVYDLGREIADKFGRRLGGSE